MTYRNKTSFFSFCLAGVAALTLGLTTTAALAQGHTGGKGSGHDAGSTSHDDGHSSHEGGSGKGKGGKGGREAGRGKGGGHQSLRDVFRDMEDEAAAEKGKKGKGASTAPKGKSSTKVTGSKPSDTMGAKGKKTDKVAAEEEDSDKPAWAGKDATAPKPGTPSTESGTKKGDIYGDVYIIERDANGLPILDADGYVKVKYYDLDGNLVCCLERNDDGDLIPIQLSENVVAVPIEVEFGRLSVGRSPERVLSAQYDEAVNLINSGTSIKLDAAGRIVVVLEDGTEKTIDSPLSNLAIYYELIATSTLAGVDPAVLGTYSYLVDGTLNTNDLVIAASLFAAASDKTIPVSVDSIAYMNIILDLATYVADTDPNTTDFVDYTNFTYDRLDTYGTLEVTVLVEQPDGTWKPTAVNVYEAVFSSTPTGDLSNIAAFTTAADDARLVINFIHEYSVPTATTN